MYATINTSNNQLGNKTMHHNHKKVEQIEAAERVLYRWACGHFTTKNVKASCQALGFTIDFRQADVGACLEAIYSDGSTITLEV